MPLENIHNITPTQTYPFDILYFIRVTFYIFVFVKFVQVLSNQRRQSALRQRIQRKYLFSQREAVKNFTINNLKIMNITLDNTVQNTRSIPNRKNQQKIVSNTVTFQTGRDDSFEPTPQNDIDNLFEGDLHQTLTASKIAPFLQEKKKFSFELDQQITQLLSSLEEASHPDALAAGENPIQKVDKAILAKAF